MQAVELTINNYQLTFDQARAVAELLAIQDNELATLVSWNDRDKNVHSPQCLQCEIKGVPGWEVYGKNHEGRLRISFNSNTFVFIYS
jgi:hypothetical protein